MLSSCICLSTLLYPSLSPAMLIFVDCRPHSRAPLLSGCQLGENYTGVSRKLEGKIPFLPSNFLPTLPW